MISPTEVLWYNSLTINKKLTTDDLVKKFLKQGGQINKYYLQSWNRNKPTLVYLHGWHSGKNFREAILKALS